jgi:hypothetical protein
VREASTVREDVEVYVEESGKKRCRACERGKKRCRACERGKKRCM